MTVKQIAMILGIAGLTMLFAINAYGQAHQEAISEKRITISVRDRPLGDILNLLIADYDIAIGLEQSNLDPENDFRFTLNKPEMSFHTEEEREFHLRTLVRPAERHRYSLQYTSAPVATIMDDLMGQMKNYAWEITDEVVNIYPTAGRDRLLAQLSDLRIRRFSIRKGADFDTIQAMVAFGLPEVQSLLRANRSGAESYKGGEFLNAEYPVRMDLNFSDLTYRELLNAIVRTKRGGWLLKRQILSRDGEELGVVFVFI